MGHYTEFFFRAHLDEKVPEFIHLRDWLHRFINVTAVDEPYNAHPFFDAERWQSLFMGAGAVWQITHPPEFEVTISYTSLSIHSSFKHGGEIPLFLDFILPFVYPPDGMFLGFSQSDTSDTPTLYFKGPDGLEVL